jgi:hypothetical protein
MSTGDAVAACGVLVVFDGRGLVRKVTQVLAQPLESGRVRRAGEQFLPDDADEHRLSFVDQIAQRQVDRAFGPRQVLSSPAQRE